MNDDAHATTQQLLKKIDQKDKRFRLFSALFGIGILVGILFLLTISLQNQQAIKVQNDQQAKLLEAQGTLVDEIKANTDIKLEEVVRRLDCISTFFGTENRQYSTIQNVDTCVIE